MSEDTLLKLIDCLIEVEDNVRFLNEESANELDAIIIQLLDQRNK